MRACLWKKNEKRTLFCTSAIFGFVFFFFFFREIFHEPVGRTRRTFVFCFYIWSFGICLDSSIAMRVRQHTSMQGESSRRAASAKLHTTVQRRLSKAAALAAEINRKMAVQEAHEAEVAAVHKAETHKRREERRYDEKMAEGGKCLQPLSVSNGVEWWEVCPHNRLLLQCGRCAMIAYEKKRLDVDVICV